VSTRSRKINNALTRTNNFLAALFWLALGIAGVAAGASGFGGVGTIILGVLVALYGLYGFGRHVFYR
jgi:hypothetical protein